MRNRKLSRQSGFTLIELMIVIVVVAIGLALAIPSYTEAINKRGVINATEQTVAALLTAKTLAVKLNAPITVTIAGAGGASWCLVATADTASCDCTQANFGANCTGIRAIAGADGATTYVIDDELDDGLASDLQEEVEIYLVGADGVSNSDFERATMNAASADPLAFTFDPVRGILTDDNAQQGNFEFESTDGNYGLRVNVNALGTISACRVSDDDKKTVAGYVNC